MSDDIQSPTVQAQIDPSQAALGDMLTLTIKVTHPNGYIVEPPVLEKNLGTFEVRASTQLPTELTGPEQTQLFQAELQNFTTGQQLLPGIAFTYHDLMGKPHALSTPELKVTIQEVPPGPKDKGDIRGIRGPVGPVAWSPWWWVLLGVIVVGTAVYFWLKRKKMIPGPPPPPPVPADEVALKKLQELSAGDLVTAGKVKEFYSALSDILRAYLEGGFRITALERTTNELMRDVRKRLEFDPQHVVELKNLLEDCDLVKFAKFRPDTDQALLDHRTAVHFVEATRGAMRSSAPKGAGRGA